MCYGKMGELFFLSLYMSFTCERWQREPRAGRPTSINCSFCLCIPRDPISTNNRFTYGKDSMERPSDKTLSDSYLQEWPSPELVEVNHQVDCM